MWLSRHVFLGFRKGTWQWAPIPQCFGEIAICCSCCVLVEIQVMSTQDGLNDGFWEPVGVMRRKKHNRDDRARENVCDHHEDAAVTSQDV
jgi:hypothetical protein